MIFMNHIRNIQAIDESNKGMMILLGEKFEANNLLDYTYTSIQ